MNVGNPTRETCNLCTHLVNLTNNSCRTKDRLRSKIVKESKERFIEEFDKDSIVIECEQSARLGNHEYIKEFTIDSTHPAYKLKYFEVQSILQDIMTSMFKGDGLRIEVSVNMSKKAVISIAWY